MAAGLEYEATYLDGNFGVAVHGVDVARLSSAGVRGLLLLLYANRFLVLRTEGVTQEQYVAFARRMGEPIRLSRDERFPEIACLTNVGVDTVQEQRGAAHWHTDQSFRKTVSSITMLYSVQAPKEGGATRFCDMAAAYGALDAQTKARIEDLVVKHRHGVSVAARPGDHVPIPPPGWDQAHTVHHPLVRRHPVTGAKTLYAPTGTSQGIRGIAPAKATALLRELCEHAFQERFVAEHIHRRHDLVIWDNPMVMHSATPLPAATNEADTRLIHRISLRGMPPGPDDAAALP